MAQHFDGTFFDLHFPDQWEEIIVENIPTFFDPDGGGVLQAAATRNPDGVFDIAWELERYLTRQGIELDPQKIVGFQNSQGLDSLVCEYRHQDRFWMVSVTSHENAMVFLIFNSDEIPDPETAKHISEIIQSLRFLTVEKSGSSENH